MSDTHGVASGLTGARIVVTGGLGFIGSHLVERLLALGNQVTVIDKDEEKISTAPRKAEVVIQDVTEGEKIGRYFKNASCIFHLAAITDYELSFKAPSLINKNNILGTLEVLRQGSRLGVGRVIYTSSAAVYGEALAVPINESHQTKPISPYGISKLTAEHYCHTFHRSFGLGTTSLRLFNVYGPGQVSGSYSGVITRFFSGISDEGAVTIYGNGEQTRDFVFIDDVVDALVAAAGSDSAVGRTMNVASGSGTTINQLLSAISELSGREASVRHEAPRRGEIYRSEADTSLAQKIIGYRPRTSLDAGLRKYRDWLRRSD